MRDYAKVAPQFWIGKTGKSLRSKGMEAQVVAMYLITCPHSNMLGMYYIPMMYIAHETGLGFEGASKGLARAIEAGFCSYDHDSEVVWVHEMAFYQIAPALEGKDKRIAGVQNEYDAVPDNPFLERFFEKYAGPFKIERKRVSELSETSPFQATLEGLASQEQEQEQEQKQEKEQKTHVEQQAARPRFSDDVDRVFEFWKQEANSPRSKLDDKRRKAIVARLKDGFSAADLCKAVSGCLKTPHNIGMNEAGQKYIDIELICRSTSNVERFMRNDDNPPVPQGKQARVEAINQAAVDEFLKDSGGIFGGSGERVIDGEVVNG